MIVANLAWAQPLAGGERKPRNYNAATLEFIPLPATSSLLLRPLFIFFSSKAYILNPVEISFSRGLRIDLRI